MFWGFVVVCFPKDQDCVKMCDGDAVGCEQGGEGEGGLRNKSCGYCHIQQGIIASQKILSCTWV